MGGRGRGNRVRRVSPRDALEGESSCPSEIELVPPMPSRQRRGPAVIGIGCKESSRGVCPMRILAEVQDVRWTSTAVQESRCERLHLWLCETTYRSVADEV